MKFELLSNLDLEYYARKFKIPLNNVLPKDIFNNIIPKSGNYIVNLDNSDGNGSHWTALILTQTCAIYFDSFGQPMPQSILRFIRKYSKSCKIIYSRNQIQALDSVFCGWYCLNFLYFFSAFHRRIINYGVLLNKHNSMFNINDVSANDLILRKMIKNIYDKL